MWHKLSQSELLANDQAMKKAISDNVKALAQKSTAKVEKMKVSKSRSFHQARKFLRDLRYSLEGLDGAIPEIHGEEIKRLHRQQDYLGRVQDLEVIADVLRDLRDGLSPKEKAEVKKICKRLSKEQSKLQKKGKKRSQKDLGWLKELGEA